VGGAGVRGRRALRRRPHRLRPRRRVATRAAADPGARDRHGAGAAGLQLVLVLPGARAHAATGGGGRGGRAGLLRAGGAGARRRRGDRLRGRPLCRGRGPARCARALRPRPAARRTGARPGGALLRADGRRGGGGGGVAGRAVGLRPAGGPGDRRARALRRRRRRAEPAPRARARRRARERHPPRRPGTAAGRRGRPRRG
jgi:hypothetical protein